MVVVDDERRGDCGLRASIGGRKEAGGGRGKNNLAPRHTLVSKTVDCDKGKIPPSYQARSRLFCLTRAFSCQARVPNSFHSGIEALEQGSVAPTCSDPPAGAKPRLKKGQPEKVMTHVMTQGLGCKGTFLRWRLVSEGPNRLPATSFPSARPLYVIWAATLPHLILI